MDTKQLVAALKEIEPHVEGDVVQQNYLEVRFQDPIYPDITYPINLVKGKFTSVVEGEPRFIITLGTA